jgi:geranylgeranyl diphosphate synthase type II
MDKAPLRRGKPTVHEQYGENTALLAGDVMLVAAYDCLNSINTGYIHSVVSLFNKMAREVCEGQQLDMDFEKRDEVTLDEYLQMIGLKTSVLLAACLKLGSILGGASLRNQNLLYEFGKKLGIAFQIQDDYLDTFGDPHKVGKQPGGDIRANKKTFLLVQAMTIANPAQKEEMMQLMKAPAARRTAGMTRLFEECRVNEWALELKNRFLDDAFTDLEDVAVLSVRKQPLKEMARFLVQRDY